MVAWRCLNLCPSLHLCESVLPSYWEVDGLTNIKVQFRLWVLFKLCCLSWQHLKTNTFATMLQCFSGHSQKPVNSEKIFLLPFQCEPCQGGPCLHVSCISTLPPALHFTLLTSTSPSQWTNITFHWVESSLCWGCGPIKIYSFQSFSIDGEKWQKSRCYWKLNHLWPCTRISWQNIHKNQFVEGKIRPRLCIERSHTSPTAFWRWDMRKPWERKLPEGNSLSQIFS